LNVIFLPARGAPAIAEIDIIAKKKDVFAFVEVKTIHSKSGWRFLPQDKINDRKLWKIAKAAELWLSKHRIPLNVKWRIDVIAIELLEDTRPAFIRRLFGPKTKIVHFKNEGHG